MTFDWYMLFSKTDFEALDLVARVLTVQLESRGRVQFLITKGNTLAVTYLDQILPVSFLDANPYTKGGYAVYLDASHNVWFGFEVEA